MMQFALQQWAGLLSPQAWAPEYVSGVSSFPTLRPETIKPYKSETFPPQVSALEAQVKS